MWPLRCAHMHTTLLASIVTSSKWQQPLTSCSRGATPDIPTPHRADDAQADREKYSTTEAGIRIWAGGDVDNNSRLQTSADQGGVAAGVGSRLR